ncbi:MAG TPA: hypothetical protein VF933_05940 [Streptosporangiaceae bacterium]
MRLDQGLENRRNEWPERLNAIAEGTDKNECDVVSGDVDVQGDSLVHRKEGVETLLGGGEQLAILKALPAHLANSPNLVPD